MSTAQDLTELQKYAVAVQKAIQAQPIADNYQSLVQRLNSAIEETIKATSTPVKIGLVGEFNAGKTLLLGALVGCGSVLPISSIPTTGNITALEFVQHPDSEIKATEVGPYTIEYLNHQEVNDCLAHLLEEAGKRASDDKKLSAVRLDELRTLQVKVGRSGVWEGVEAWGKATWNETSNPRLRHLLRELVWLARCYVAAGTTLCGTGGTRYEVEERTARAGLTLPVSKRDIQMLSFAELPLTPPAMTAAPATLTVELLQATFPLIRRCRVRIKLSRQIWNLAALRAENPFILLDFPGLGADSSGVRDRFLCLRELADVHTILVLLDGQRPGAGGILEVYDMMQRDRANLRDSILVAVSRFDLLPLGAEQGQALQRLGVPPTTHEASITNNELNWFGNLAEESLDDNQVYRELPVLQTVVAGAQAFTSRNDRIVLLSSVLGLADLAENYPALAIGSEGLREELNGVLPSARAIRDQWQALSRQLEAASAPGPLTKWLIAFSEDGGLAALRDLLQTHVQQHGLDLLYQNATEKVARLDHVLDELKVALSSSGSPPLPPRDGPDRQVRDNICNLLRIYNDWKSEFQNAPPDLLRTTTSDQTTSIPLIEMVHEEVVSQVFAWPEWQRLFNSVKRGYLEPQQSASVIDDQSPQPGVNIPASGEDFYQLFRQTYQFMDHFVRRQAERALDEWLASRAEQVAGFSGKIGLNDAARQRVRERLPERGDFLFNRLFLATKLNQLKSNLVKLSRLREEANHSSNEADGRCQRIFPLHRQRAFAWHREMLEICSKGLRHQTQLLSLRNELINSASRELTEFVSQVNHILVRLLQDLFNELSNCLWEMINNHDFIAALSSAEHPAPTASTMQQLADRLSELSSPLNP